MTCLEVFSWSSMALDASAVVCRESPGVRYLRCPKVSQEEEVQQLATADHPESHRLQESLNLLRPANTFSNTDFRHWGLLQNVMGALSKPQAPAFGRLLG